MMTLRGKSNIKKISIDQSKTACDVFACHFRFWLQKKLFTFISDEHMAFQVKLDELMIAKVELEEKEGELNLEIEQLNKRLSQSDEMHAKEIEAIVVGNVSRKKN